MLSCPTLVALLLKWAMGFNIIVVPAILTEALELVKWSGGRVSLGGRAPTVIWALRDD